MAGHLLLRTFQRAERIHTAMLARGFVGRFYSHRQSSFGASELCFLIGWSLLFAALRFFDLTNTLGTLVTGIAP
jgi:cobalt/nickel transport system permease protein